MTELNPCPFCGSEKISLNKPSKFWPLGSINCPACMAIVPGAIKSNDQAELIDCWNTRASSPAEGAEPVAWLAEYDGYFAATTNRDTAATWKNKLGRKVSPLYAAPQSDEVERLQKENFAFAAGLCPHHYGDDYGHSRCKEIDRLEAEVEKQRCQLVKAREALLVIRSNANCHESEAVLLATMPLIFETATRASREISLTEEQQPTVTSGIR